MASEVSFPKTTRPSAKKQREKPAEKTMARKLSKKLDAFPDRIDVRDWFYQPTLAPLPSQLINCDKVPAILNQGQEGACTGFALAAVINYHLCCNGRCNVSDIVKLTRYPSFQIHDIIYSGLYIHKTPIAFCFQNQHRCSFW